MAALTEHSTLPLPRFDAPVRLLIVVAPYYRAIADALIAGARRTAEAAGASVDLVEVPGALEVPTAIGIAERMSNFDGYVALGCIIRGETTHYDTVCNDSSRGLTLLGLQGLCIGNGILTVENMAQAIKQISIGQGVDPAGYALASFGGAGGQHACLVADALGNVAEAATANAFAVKDGEVFTPVPNGTFLAGITRARHIENLRADGVTVHECVLSFDDFHDADEVFLSGNMMKVTPVTAFDDTHYQIGPVTRRVREMYWDWAASA